jgi:hypothetical protein
MTYLRRAARSAALRRPSSYRCVQTCPCVPATVGGEHHPIDVIAGALMGAGALCVALFAARTARRVAELRTVRHAERRAAEARA